MKKMTLVDGNGNVLGMGYMNNTEEDLRCLRELKKQIRNSGIQANLEIEDTEDINMTELGIRMERYQNTQDLINQLTESFPENEDEWLGYDIGSIIHR